MTRTLLYGDDEVLRLEPADDAAVVDFSRPRGQPAADPIAALDTALADPLHFPVLREATVAGDRITIAVERSVPQADALIAGIIANLLAGSTAAELITVLLADEIAAADEAELNAAVELRRRLLASHLPPEVAAAIELAIHKPGDRQQLAYLAASKENRPILVNRRLFDADLIVPLGCLRPSHSLGEIGTHGGLFPTFADDETQRRFRAPWSSDAAVHQRLRRNEADEAAWLLGAPLSIQVVAGPGDSVLQVLVGESADVAARGRERCDAAWLHELPQRADLVIAAISGGPTEQTWENFARALFAADAAATDNGTIVLCTSLCCRPGPALQRLAAFDDDDRTIRELQRDRSEDAVAASLLLEMRQRHRLFLLSELDESTVEDLGLGHVADPAELNRLIRKHDRVLLLGDAHRAMVRIRDESAGVQ